MRTNGPSAQKRMSLMFKIVLEVIQHGGGMLAYIKAVADAHLHQQWPVVPLLNSCVFDNGQALDVSATINRRKIIDARGMPRCAQRYSIPFDEVVLIILCCVLESVAFVQGRSLCSVCV